MKILCFNSLKAGLLYVAIAITCYQTLYLHSIEIFLFVPIATVSTHYRYAFVCQLHLIIEVRKLLFQRRYSRRRHGVIGAAAAAICIPRTLWPHRT